MPRTSRRISCNAVADASLALPSSARAACGSLSSSCSAAPIVMPIATRRAWAPSCRSRSIRRSSAAWESTASVRAASRRLTRWASLAFSVGPSRAAANWPCRRTAHGAYQGAAIIASRIQTTPIAALPPAAHATPYATASSGAATTKPPAAGAESRKARSRQVAGSLVIQFHRLLKAGIVGFL